MPVSNDSLFTTAGPTAGETRSRRNYRHAEEGIGQHNDEICAHDRTTSRQDAADEYQQELLSDQGEYPDTQL